MLTATNLSKIFGTQVLFADTSLQLDAGKRYGIVGANGSGKSTLLRMLTGEEGPSEGTVIVQKRARIGVLGQDHFAYEDTSIREVVMMGNTELWAAMAEKEVILAADEFDDARYSQLEDIVLRFDGYSLHARAGEILEGLGIATAQHDEPLSVLSGGFKLRVLLGQTLASEPDLLMLDEPTNHLDILSIQWLEDFLGSFRGCAVVISHDHRFLDRISTHILDVDYAQVTQYTGNYEAFVKLKTETRSRMEAEISRREKEIAEHKAFIARFKAKASKARQANSRAKRVEKMTIVELPVSSRRHPTFKLAPRRPSGREVLKVKGLWKAYEENSVLEEVTFNVERGDRIAIIGENGIGKSTLLKIIMDKVAADVGEFTWGYEADPGYFPQDHGDCFPDPDQNVMSYLWDSKPDATIGFVYGKLAEVLFEREDTEKKVSNLSGGEIARLLFCRLGIQQTTVLVLDEPTNHLDIEGIESLARDLKRYEGTVVFVSHNRWFVEQIATRVLELSRNGLDDFHGTYTEFIDRKKTDHLDEVVVIEQAKAKKKQEKKKRKKAKR
ncbi:MAG: ATPase subunit of ABC transporter with duplicated ATPase domains [Myxococcota bacterium]|jgi:ATPase subunit of ABC transporter with duplicated ATPase domains